MLGRPVGVLSTASSRPPGPVRSRMTWLNDSAEQANCTVVLAGAGLQNQKAACRVADGFDSRPPPPPASWPCGALDCRHFNDVSGTESIPWIALSGGWRRGEREFPDAQQFRCGVDGGRVSDRVADRGGRDGGGVPRLRQA